MWNVNKLYDSIVSYKGEKYRINPETKEIESSISGVNWQRVEHNLPTGIDYIALKVYDSFIFIIDKNDYIYAYSTDGRDWKVIFEKSIFDKTVENPWEYIYIFDKCTLLGIDKNPIAYAFIDDRSEHRYSFIKTQLRMHLSIIDPNSDIVL